MSIITVTSNADNGVGSLRQAVANASSGDTITFSSSLANQTITLTSGQIEIPAGKNLTIDGKDAANLNISGNHASRILHLNSNQDSPTSLRVQNLAIANGYTQDTGGGILSENKAQLTLSNVNFKNNVADQGGGAVYSAWDTSLTVTGSKFDSNKAIAGNNELAGGAISFISPGQFTVKDSEFTNNRGINGGAIKSLNGKLTVENSQFINNDATAAFYGGSNPSIKGYGGAISTDRASSTNESSGQIRISGSVFEGNKAANGGAAYLYTATQDNVIVENSSFKNNQALGLSGGESGDGGALLSMTNGLNKGLTINNSSFENNTAAESGGGLWMMGAPTKINNSTFSGNDAKAIDYGGNGGAMALNGPTDIVNSKIINNHAGWVGGGVVAGNDTVTVKGSIFENNTADNGTNHWGIEQQTSRELTDLGGNIQWPAKLTNNWNDYNVTANVTIAEPSQSDLQKVGSNIADNGISSGNSIASTGNTPTAGSGTTNNGTNTITAPPNQQTPITSGGSSSDGTNNTTTPPNQQPPITSGGSSSDGTNNTTTPPNQQPPITSGDSSSNGTSNTTTPPDQHTPLTGDGSSSTASQNKNHQHSTNHSHDHLLHGGHHNHQTLSAQSSTNHTHDHLLYGGQNHHILTGTPANDTFVLTSGQGTDLIRHFQTGKDHIGLSGNLSLGQISISQEGNQSLIFNKNNHELLAKLDGVNASTLQQHTATTFVHV